MPDQSLVEKVSQVQGSIRQKPSDDKLRIHLFQLYVQEGKWQKALVQLQMAAQLNASHKMMAQAYRLAIRAEMLREDVFKGRRSPNVLGQPLQWISFLIEALQEDGKGNPLAALELRLQALDEANAVSGRLNEQPFNWIADADSRLGPVLEVLVNGDYYWLPFEAISEVKIDAPVDLRDLVWIPAHVKLVNEGYHPMLLPARYPLLDMPMEDAHLQSKISTWTAMEGDLLCGQGVKVLSTDTSEASLLDVRSIHLQSALSES
ncbi:type VI secretion system protein ImpE [Comamonas odontotermitis]|uniref:Type VI secretion system protein ImpE n=1 Tax=Comamonas odontotermitis TaxID=379895 RepID=A0ABR6RI07_9BURK|nr:type VI secretion system accessory protein TagJ [Comamonas odontotermitis]MBB6578802.1 type VI secretion system protein ImpE [Comamonas odontotermitis]